MKVKRLLFLVMVMCLASSVKSQVYQDVKTFDLKGNVKKCIDEVGAVLEFEKNGKLIPNANRNEKIVYNSQNRISKRTQSLIVEAAYEYDSYGRLAFIIYTIMGVESKNQMHYNSKNQIIKQTWGENQEVYSDYIYDNKNNWISRKANGRIQKRTIEYY